MEDRMLEVIETGSTLNAGRPTAQPPPAARGEQFPDTCWAWIREASGDDGREAFGHLCQAYWYPVYCFLRRHGASASDASDITQDFFVHLLTSDKLAKVEPREDCRFRTWLRTRAKRYFLNSLRRAKAGTRGGDAPHLRIDGVDAERRLAGELMHTLTPDRLFDRCWARTVTERARESLHRSYPARADVELMDEAVADLSGTAEPPDPAPASGRTPVPGAERTRKSRRKGKLLGEYTKYLRREIRGTVGRSDLIDHEICVLLDVLPCRKTT
jgi:RNA polymerase sigma factor (sigma-70 family)